MSVLGSISTLASGSKQEKEAALLARLESLTRANQELQAAVSALTCHWWHWRAVVQCQRQSRELVYALLLYTVLLASHPSLAVPLK